MARIDKAINNRAENVDETMLWDMVDATALQDLMESFGQICGTGSGIFTPRGVRIGKPAHNSPFCLLLYTTKEVKGRCSKCDNARIKQIRHGKIIGPYRCDAGLVDFCEPIHCQIGGDQWLVGVFFAGEVLYQHDKMSSGLIKELREVATMCKVDPDELFANYMQVPGLPGKRVGEIKAWMKQFRKLT